MLIIGSGFFFKLAIDPVGREFVLIVGVIFLIPGLMLVSLAMRSRLILDGSRIELRSALRTFTADRSEIEGLRKGQNQYGSWTRICLKENRGAFNVSDSFSGNAELYDWFKGLTDLDQRDADQITLEIGKQDSLGAAEDDKGLNALKQAKAWAIGLSVIAGLISIPVMFVSYTLLYTVSLTLLVLSPLLGIFLLHRFRLLFTFFKSKTDPRADIGFVIIWPGIAMLMSYQTGNDPTRLVDVFQLIYWVLLAIVCYIATLFRIAWKSPSPWGMFAGILIFGGIYSTGLINVINTMPDSSIPSPYQTVVLKMYETQGRHASTYLRLAPWGPMAYSDDVDVPKRIYQQVTVGDQICIGMHSGFLHAPWYTLAPCPKQLSAPVPLIQ